MAVDAGYDAGVEQALLLSQAGMPAQAVALAEDLLPNGLAEGCVLTRDVPKDQVLTYDDVDVPEGRLADALRAEQTRQFAAELGGVPSAA